MTRDRRARRHYLTGRAIRCGTASALVTVVPDLVTCSRCRQFMASDEQQARDTAEARQAFLDDWRQAQAPDLRLAADEHADDFFASLTPATLARVQLRRLRRLTEGETALIRRSIPA